MRRTLILCLCVLGLCGPVVSDAAQAQERDRPTPEAAPDAPKAPSIAQVQERIAQVESDADIEQATKDTILASLRAALESLQRRDAARAETQQLVESTAAVPGTLQQLRNELDQPVVPPSIGDFSRMNPDAALEAIGDQLAQAQARLVAARDEQARLQSEAAAREARLNEAPGHLVRWQEELAESTTTLAALPAETGDPAAQSRRWLLQAQAAELASRIARVEADVANITARREVLPIRQNLAQRKAEAAQRQVELLQAAETEAANRKARQAQQQAQRQATQVDDETLRALANEASELAAERLGERGTRASLDMVRGDLARARTQLEDLDRRARNTVARVRAAGLTELVGRSLRDEMRRLPEINREEDRRLEAAIGQAELRLIDIEDKLNALGDKQSAIARQRQRLSIGETALAPEVERQVTEIVSGYFDTLEALRREYREFIDHAYELAAVNKSLAQSTEAFRSFIEERILWTRSVQGSLIPTTDELVNGTVWMLGGGKPTLASGIRGQSSPIGSQWYRAIVEMWPPRVLAVLTLLAFLFSLWGRRKAVVGIKSATAQVRRFSTDRMGLTLRVLLLTALATLPLPLALMLAGLLLEATSPEVSSAFGAALLNNVLLAAGLEFIRHAARTDGLADAHFRWRREGLVHLRRLVFLLEITMLPLVVIANAFAQLGDTPMGDGVGRLAFIAAQAVLASFFALALAPWLPFMRGYLGKHTGALAYQTRWLWYPMLVAAPLALAVLGVLGYYYTAAQLDQRLQLTVWLLVTITIGYNLVLRWLFIERRRLLVKRAQQKREAEKTDQPTGGGEVEGIELESPAELDAAEVDTQTRRVLSAVVLVSIVLGVYSLWTEQMPALRMLDRVQIYPTFKFQPAEESTIDVPVTAPTVLAAPGDGTRSQDQQPEASRAADSPALFPGTSTSPPSEPLRNITLADVGGAIIFFALTWILARNLPGLLEITILKRLPLDAGARFAVTSILRYIIGIFGIFLAFGAIGIGWSQVQFLAAALTFGLAFGLQEIFANFISGLIILVERPVRVGDTVTVGGINGRVTRIRMRATTVLDWELRELIIPNKVFITDQFINWTLSDPRLRLTLPVGVAYGTDTRLVMRTLQEVGQGHAHVVAEPKTRVVFVGFGDSTLNFELRVYLEHFDYFIDTRNDLNVRIAERFAEQGIEIAFPQRDLHIRSIGPLAEAMSARSAQPPHE